MNWMGIKTKIEKISEICCNISKALIIVMMALIFVDILLRLFGNTSLGSVEISELMLVAIAFFAFPFCWIQDRHINIEILVETFPKKVQSAFKAFGALVGIVFFGALMWGSIGFSIEAYKTAEITSILRIPLFPIKLIITLTSGFFCVQLVSTFISSLYIAFQNSKEGG